MLWENRVNLTRLEQLLPTRGHTIYSSKVRQLNNTQQHQQENNRTGTAYTKKHLDTLTLLLPPPHNNTTITPSLVSYYPTHYTPKYTYRIFQFVELRYIPVSSEPFRIHLFCLVMCPYHVGREQRNTYCSGKSASQQASQVINHSSGSYPSTLSLLISSTLDTNIGNFIIVC